MWKSCKGWNNDNNNRTPKLKDDVMSKKVYEKSKYSEHGSIDIWWYASFPVFY